MDMNCVVPWMISSFSMPYFLEPGRCDYCAILYPASEIKFVDRGHDMQQVCTTCRTQEHCERCREVTTASTSLTIPADGGMQLVCETCLHERCCGWAQGHRGPVTQDHCAHCREILCDECTVRCKYCHGPRCEYCPFTWMYCLMGNEILIDKN